MAKCDAAHRDYDRVANGDVQRGDLPDYMHARGKVA
jgi:hypothetical protein